MKEMKYNTCRSCKYFVQHYILTEDRFRWADCGHCTFPRPRHKTPHTKACDHYIYAGVNEERFASKPFLTKELLRYVLTMDLLPKLEEENGK